MSPKIPSGSVGLDQVLSGGLPANTITVLMGAPGSGKTILAEQIAFHNATPKAPVLYLTTLAEPLEKFIFHGEAYSFFDSAKIGKSIFYEDLGLMIREGGVEKLPELITELFVRHKPRLLFIDSFKALNELLVTDEQRRTVIYDLATVLSAYECTSILVGEYAPEMITVSPEFAIADVVIQLMRYMTNVREQRFLRVEKLRGSDSMPGMHAFTISSTGIDVHPRILTPRITPDYNPKVERVETGIKGLDEMIAEGFWRGSTTLVAGPSGSGKTIIALSFICHGALNKEPSVYLGFQENPSQLARIMLNLGWDSERLISDGYFELMYRSPVEMQMDQVATELFGRIRQGKVKRVAIDALGDLERSSIDRQRFADFIYALTQWFAVENVTCLMNTETELFGAASVTENQISNMSDNLVLLGLTGDEQLRRQIRIIKTRGSAHDHRAHELEIGSNGAVVKKVK